MPKHHNIENVTKPEAPPPSPFDQGDRLLNVKQVAEITGMSVAYLNRARIYGSEGPKFIKISKSCRYKLSSVLAWIESKQEFSSTSAQQAA